MFQYGSYYTATDFSSIKSINVSYVLFLLHVGLKNISEIDITL